MDGGSDITHRLGEVSGVVDVPRAISKLVRQAVEQEVDPYITLGVLIESIAHVLSLSIPQQKKVETAKSVTHLLLDRLAAQGLVR